MNANELLYSTKTISKVTWEILVEAFGEFISTMYVLSIFAIVLGYLKMVLFT